jgi:tetratricopeptide (TPR) repeat protein
MPDSDPSADPRWPEAYRRLHQLWQRAGLVESRLELDELLQTLGPGSFADLARARQLALETQAVPGGSARAVVDLVERAMTPDSGDPQLAVGAAIALFDAGEWNLAAAYLQAIDDVDALDDWQRASVDFMRGHLARESGEFETGLQLVRRAVEHDPDNPHFWAWLARALAEEGNTDEALGTLEAGIARCPKAVELQWLRADLRGPWGGAKPAPGQSTAHGTVRWTPRTE